MRSFLALLLGLLCLSFALVVPVRAAVCGESPPTDEGSLKTYIADCEARISESRGAQATLSQAITSLNNQISLTQAKINSITLELDKLEAEITDLSGRISTLDLSLDDLTLAFASRVRSTYIHHDASLLYLAEATGVDDYVRQAKYLLRVRDRDRNLLLALERSRLDYNAKREVKETKQQEVKAVKHQLDVERQNLSSQKSAKDKLLADTKNDEKRYQSLLSLANAQMAAFRSFVTGQGGSSLLSGQTVCGDWGCYYNQRDSLWGAATIGASSETMKEVGCLVTSMAMIASHYGKSIKPGDIAGSTAPFFSNTAYMNQGTWSVAGVTMTRTRLGSSTSLIDSELASGRPVIVGIYSGPDHFVVIKAKEGSDYIMYDPFVTSGHDLTFTSKYPLSAITTVDRVSVN